MTVKTISIFGATGTIGQNTLNLIAQNRADYEIEVLAAGQNIDLLIAQAKQFRPKHVVIQNETLYQPLKEALADDSIEVHAGNAAILALSTKAVDWVMNAIVGFAGLKPALNMLAHAKCVALANKESIVAAGPILKALAQKHHTHLLPVDSEHNAILQILTTQTNHAYIEKITLTASGGPFLHKPIEDLHAVTADEAVKHPNWVMGAKISVDSATLMNKVLEWIEAYYLFDVPAENIDILIHPQSIIHGFVHYIDGAVIAQMSMPDMRVPIAHTLAWPARMASSVPKLFTDSLVDLSFETPCEKRFPSIKLGKQALNMGNAGPIILNAANEVMVNAFLQDKIAYLDIVPLVETVLLRYPGGTVSDVEAIFGLHEWATNIADEIIKKA